MDYSYMPIGISIKKRKCLVVGGGRVALRKIDNLLDFGAEITVIAPDPDKKIEYYAERNLIKLEKRKYNSPEAADYGIVISSADDEKVNELVSNDCQKSGVPVNIVDNPGLCDIIFPAVVKRDCLTISTMTDGQAPFLSRHLRIILEEMFAEKRWISIAQLASIFRNRVQKTFPDNAEKKQACFGRFLDIDWQKILKEKPDEELSDFLDNLLDFD